ncbi:hypothetical protein AHMF7605_25700 [Adhaeribacter arboris]|uniref:Uncharacterized protein n=2 Tax=Adhaeribacter arboris TaxID=2072846 RepID=A0A2T2YMA8_9BACT|nr:hypothetical protein AHMF7605_25700 [Adhaeribacter arboris]
MRKRKWVWRIVRKLMTIYRKKERRDIHLDEVEFRKWNRVLEILSTDSMNFGLPDKFFTSESFYDELSGREYPLELQFLVDYQVEQLSHLKFIVDLIHENQPKRIREMDYVWTERSFALCRHHVYLTKSLYKLMERAVKVRRKEQFEDEFQGDSYYSKTPAGAATRWLKEFLKRKST